MRRKTAWIEEVVLKRCPRWCASREATMPPTRAPAAKAATARSDAAMENPGAPTSAKPRITTLPVMLATKTWPSSR